MKNSFLTAEILAQCFLAARKNLLNNEEYINSLDIYFSSDKDTGSNIYKLFFEISKEIELLENPSIEQICNIIIQITTTKSVGNSGIAIGLFLRKLAKELTKYNKLECFELSEAFKNALDILPRAIASPKEKSILTISKTMARRSEELYNLAYIDDFFRELLSIGNIVLETTKNKFNIPDAGAIGLLCIIESFYITISGDINLENLDEII